jgi:hypothetical protein
MTTGVHLCACPRACQADRTCVRVPRFQAYLDTAQDSQQPRIRKCTKACANHLGAMVMAMTAWAREQDAPSADLTVLIIEPPAYDPYPRQHHPRDCAQTSGFVFSVMHIEAEH